MKIEDFYKQLLKMNYNLMFNRNNFNIYESNQKVFLISGVLNLNKNKLIKHLTDSKSIVEKHRSILNINDFSKNLRYIKTELFSEYIDYPILDRLEEWYLYNNSKKSFIYCLLKEVPIEIKDKQILEFVEYIEHGCFLIVLEDINLESTRMDIFAVDLKLNPILIPAMMKNYVSLIVELDNID
tara:strand:- start:7 stop:555 length:549 start_codon:yes stop_codon:yes gene_type:complete